MLKPLSSFTLNCSYHLHSPLRDASPPTVEKLPKASLQSKALLHQYRNRNDMFGI